MLILWVSFITWLFFFSRKLYFLWLIGNKILCRPIRSVIILVIKKSESYCVVVRFCYHSYDYWPNWTRISPITITYFGKILEVSEKWVATHLASRLLTTVDVHYFVSSTSVVKITRIFHDRRCNHFWSDEMRNKLLAWSARKRVQVGRYWFTLWRKVFV